MTIPKARKGRSRPFDIDKMARLAAAGLTQRAIARAMGCSPGYVSQRTSGWYPAMLDRKRAATIAKQAGAVTTLSGDAASTRRADRGRAI